MDEITQLVREFGKKKWKCDAQERGLAMAYESPDAAYAIARELLACVQDGHTFIEDVLSYIPNDRWPELSGQAIELLNKQQNWPSADSVICHASLQCVNSLHPHLPAIFHRAPNQGSFYKNWPWREADDAAVEWLCDQIDATGAPQGIRKKAWDCLLQIRSESAFAAAIDRTKQIDLGETYTASGGLEPLTLAYYLHAVGFESVNGSVRPLYLPKPLHIAFPHDYFRADRPSWLMQHPTWTASSTAVSRARIGGIGNAVCGSCGRHTNILISANCTEGFPWVSELNRLTIECCLRCLGWVKERMYYRHESDGKPTCLTVEPGEPEFPAGDILPCEVAFVDSGERWRWQDWGNSNSRQNLNRVGGYPTWIQDAQYLNCLSCGTKMGFLMQLDSLLPTAEGGELLWGSGGIAYVFWCDSCKVSGLHWQCT
ncbi:MAG: hypothetical protein SGJ19_00910 [Planctomycetia bacterium]|nr:hypothetical protein [Planctomycetia bacterium]